MTDDRIIDIFQQHGQYVTPRDYALIRSIAEAIAPQRTWVGLTDEDIFLVLGNLQVMYNRPPTEDSRIVFARAIEAALRSKNT